MYSEIYCEIYFEIEFLTHLQIKAFCFSYEHFCIFLFLFFKNLFLPLNLFVWEHKIARENIIIVAHSLWFDVNRVQSKKVKSLTKGELRRLSIAEEIVHGPSLLLIDEPTTGLTPQDESVMLRTFREMVNQDRTVVAAMYHVSLFLRSTELIFLSQKQETLFFMTALRELFQMK